MEKHQNTLKIVDMSDPELYNGIIKTEERAMEPHDMHKLNRDLGHMEGRLSSMEQRMLQNEISVNQQLATIKQEIKESRKENHENIRDLSAANSASIRELTKELGEFQEDMRDLVSQGKGGWKLLAWVGSIAVACVGGVAWVIDKISSIGL